MQTDARDQDGHVPVAARVPCGALALNERREIVHANDGFCDAFSCSPDDVLGLLFDDLIHERNHSGRCEYLQAIIRASHKPSEILLTLRVAGANYHVRLHIWQQEGASWTVRAERINGTPLERALERHRQWSAVIRDSSDGIALCDRDGTIVEYNSQFLELVHPVTHHGVRKLDDAVGGQKLLELLDGRLHARLAPALGAPNTRERRFSGEISHRGAQLSIRLSPAHDAMGGYLGSVLVVRDITAQHRHKRLSTAVEQVNESIVITDAAGVIQYVNPAFERVTGYTQSEAIGQHTRILKSGVQSDEFYSYLWKTILSGKVWSGRISNKKKDGTALIEEATISPVVNERGVIANFVAVKKDITEQVALENRARQSQKLEAIGQLAAGIAHEINTPVQFVSDNTVFLQRAFSGLVIALEAFELLLEEAKVADACPDAVERAEKALKKAKINFLMKQIPRAVNQSLEGLQRVAGIVSAMKEFSHPSQGAKQAVDLRKAVETTITVSAPNEWKYVAEMDTEFDPDLPPVPCLRDELNQVVLNIIVNAAHAISDVTNGGSEGKGTIRLSTKQDGDWAELRISDTGSGIPEEVRDRVFDPFFTTKQVGKGTGQGLAIARSVVVDKHGGTIEIDPSTGAGTTFVIRLPLRDSQVPPAEGEAA